MGIWEKRKVRVERLFFRIKESFSEIRRECKHKTYFKKNSTIIINKNNEKK